MVSRRALDDSRGNWGDWLCWNGSYRGALSSWDSAEDPRPRGHPWATNAPDEVEVVVGDLHDKAACRIWPWLNACFHYAARASFTAPEQQLQKINVGDAQSSRASARDRIVMASTQAAVLRDADIVDGDESLSTHAVDFDPYGRSKAEAEALVTAHLNGYVVRPPWVWGAGDTTIYRRSSNPNTWLHALYRSWPE